MVDVMFFNNQEGFSDWLGEHAEASELWVGYFKKSAGRASLTWSESRCSMAKGAGVALNAKHGLRGPGPVFCENNDHDTITSLAPLFKSQRVPEQ